MHLRGGAGYESTPELSQPLKYYPRLKSDPGSSNVRKLKPRPKVNLSTSKPKTKLTFVRASDLAHVKRIFLPAKHAWMTGKTDPLRNEEEPVEPVETPKNETQQTVFQRWETHQKRWQASSGLTSLQDVLTQYIAEHGTPVISDMICIGLGSLSGTDGCGNLNG